MRKWIWTLLLLFLVKNATAFSLSETPLVLLDVNRGTVRYYTHLSRQQFQAKTNHKSHPGHIVAGLTVPHMRYSYYLIPEIKKKGKQVYISIQKIRVEMGNDLDVYIDKKYTVGTCKYRVIMQHENYHVRVYQEALTFYKKDIEKALQRISKNMTPKLVQNQAEIEAYMQEHTHRIAQELSHLIERIMQKADEKHAVIDTEESYRNTWAVCHHAEQE